MRYFSSFFFGLPVLVKISLQLSQTPETLFGSCPPFSGNITIDQLELYPENADFDFKSCLLYIGALFNASVVFYDPYKTEIVDILDFPGIANNPLYHIGGVGVDKTTSLVSIVQHAADAFKTGRNDISGTNLLLQYNPYIKALDYKINLTQTTHGCTVDSRTWNRSHLAMFEPWFISQPFVQTRAGLGGLAATGFTLLATDMTNMSLYKFDMLAPKGTLVLVPLTPPTELIYPDAIYLPPRYGETVLLVTQDLAGVAVLRSKDGLWNSAEYLGVVPIPVAGSFSTAAAQVGNSLYMVLEFYDAALPDYAYGDRSLFPFPDITKAVEKLFLA